MLKLYETGIYLVGGDFPFCIGFLAALALYPLRKWFERRLHARRELAGFLALFSGLP